MSPNHLRRRWEKILFVGKKFQHPNVQRELWNRVENESHPKRKKGGGWESHYLVTHCLLYENKYLTHKNCVFLLNLIFSYKQTVSSLNIDRLKSRSSGGLRMICPKKRGQKILILQKAPNNYIVHKRRNILMKFQIFQKLTAKLTLCGKLHASHECTLLFVYSMTMKKTPSL